MQAHRTLDWSHALAFALPLMLTGCTGESTPPRAEVGRGIVALQDYGCGACHRIPGVAGANGVVGPPLADLRRQVYIAGNLPNTVDNMIRWIREPQAIVPQSVMPDMHVTQDDARSMTAYLRSLE